MFKWTTKHSSLIQTKCQNSWKLFYLVLKIKRKISDHVENIKLCSHDGKGICSFSKIKNIRLVYSTTVPLLGMYSKELKAQSLNRYLFTCVHSSTIHNRYKMETSQMFINRWMNTQNIVHTYHEISFSLKKEFNSDTWYNMDKPLKTLC